MLETLMRSYKLLEWLLSNAGELSAVESLVKQLVVETEGAVRDLGHDPGSLLAAVEQKPNPLTEDVNAIAPVALDVAAEIEKIWANLNNVLKSLGLEKK